MSATHTTNTDADKNWPPRRCEAMAEDLRPHYGAGPDIGEDYESTGAVAWREFKRALHSYFEPVLSLTPAGKFWIGYVLGLLSALLMPHWLA